MRQADSTFIAYEFTAEELKQGQAFNSTNIAYLQTLRCKYAEEKIGLTYDVDNQLKFVQREAELQGQINLLTQLIEESEIANKP